MIKIIMILVGISIVIGSIIAWCLNKYNFNGFNDGACIKITYENFLNFYQSTNSFNWSLETTSLYYCNSSSYHAHKIGFMRLTDYFNYLEFFNNKEMRDTERVNSQEALQFLDEIKADIQRKKEVEEKKIKQAAKTFAERLEALQ